LHDVFNDFLVVVVDNVAGDFNNFENNCDLLDNTDSFLSYHNSSKFVTIFIWYNSVM